MLVTTFNRPIRRAARSEAVAVRADTAEGRQAAASFLSDMAKGAKVAPTLEEAVSAGVKACGPEFGDFLAQRYGGRVAKAALAAGEN